MPNEDADRGKRVHRGQGWLALWQWAALGVGIALTMVLGCWGFARHAADHGQPWTVLDIVYRSVQLFVLESGAYEPPLPWQAEVARYLALVVAGGTVVKTLWMLFRKQVEMLKLRFRKGHVVVCGLGQRGRQLVEDCRRNGAAVVAIERDADNDNIQPCVDLGAMVLIGDATDEAVLQKARVPFAGHVVATCEADGANITVAVVARTLADEWRPATVPALRAFIHLADEALFERLGRHACLTTGDDRFQPCVFNVYENAARRLLADFPFDQGRVRADSSVTVHLVLVGFGQMGRCAALQFARMGSYGNMQKPRLTVIGPAADGLGEAFLAKRPGFADVCDVAFRAADPYRVETREAIRAWASEPDTVTTVVVCLDNDAHNLAVALGVASEMPDDRTPVLVHLFNEEALAGLLDGNAADLGVKGPVRAFGLAREACSRNVVLREELDTLARAIHQDFVRQREPEARTDASVMAWDRLKDDLKSSNRQQAGHIPIKLRAVGCEAGPSGADRFAVARFSEDEVDAMARMEHRRWCAERRLAGWTWAEAKDIDKRQSPYLVGWDALPDEVKEYDREPVRAIPRLLGLIGQKVYRCEASA